MSVYTVYLLDNLLVQYIFIDIVTSYLSGIIYVTFIKLFYRIQRARRNNPFLIGPGSDFS